MEEYRLNEKVSRYINLEYYRHSPISDLKSIMTKGLNSSEANSNLRKYTSDERKKVFYSEGKEGAITFDCNSRSKFKQMQGQGKVPSDYTMDSFYKNHDKGQDRVYLKIHDIELNNEQDDNMDRFADAYTSQIIPPENISVCVLINPQTGEITYRREDVIKYMMSQCSVQDIENKYEIDDRQKQKLINQYNEMQEEIQKFSKNEMQEIGIEQFYQMISIQLQKGKDGFEDCLDDDKTRLSNMQSATKTTKANVLEDVHIKHTNDEQNLE